MGDSELESLGRYDIVQKVGEGGFGEVFEAYDPHLRRRVAIKTCNATEQEQRDRFAQEAALAGSLHHRNLTATYDFSSSDDLAYVVQEFLEGEDLDKIIERRDDISVSTKLLYLIQLARGLRHVHSNGVVHRDVKPSNVRVLPTGQIKLMDFGIAESMESEQPTLAGETMGTAAYLAPEQIRGDAVDQRCDVYSFGATAYELLSLQRPFPGEDATEVLGAVMKDDPPPMTDHWKECPPALASLVHRCLERDPDRRYSGMDQVLHDFDRILGDDSGKKNAASSRGTDDTQRDVENLDATMVLGADPALHSGAAEATDRTQLLEQPTIVMEATSPNAVGEPSLRQAAPIKPLAIESTEPRGLSLATFILGLALMGILGAGAASLYFGNDGPEGALDEESAQDASNTAANGTQPPVQGPLPSGQQASTPESSASNAAETTLAAGTDRSAGNEVAPARTGTLVLEPAWSPQLQARVDGRSVTLDQRRTFRLSPGTYTVAFRLDDDPATGWNESQAERRTIQIVADRVSTLATELERPGAVTIRAALGAPQAFVRVDGEPLGWAPISEQVLPPGSYEVSASAGPTDKTPILAYPLTVNSGEETVITFNIESASPPVSTVKDWTP